jgi:hypothetical protein
MKLPIDLHLVALYFHCPIRLHGIALDQSGTGHLYRTFILMQIVQRAQQASSTPHMEMQTDPGSETSCCLERRAMGNFQKARNVQFYGPS